MAASEVRKGDFVYRDTLFVEVAENKRHTRASAPELKELLLPKKGSAPAKDQVAHWYEAQLVHYGLPRTKDKNTAKVRLTTALVSDTLRVPSNVTQLEAEMKKEFASNVRKAKAAEKKTQESKVSDEGATKGKKRKADDTEHTSTTKVSVKVGDVTFEINHTGGPTSKKTKAEPAASKKAAPKAKVLPPTPTKATKPKPAATKTAESKSTLPKTAKPKPTTPRSPRSKPSTKPASIPTPSPARPKLLPGTARRSKPFQYGSQSSRPAASPPQQVHDHTPASFYDSDVDMDDDPPPYDSHDFTEVNGPSNDMENDSVSGFYNISVCKSTLYGVLTLSMFQSTGQAWGNFRIGSKAGIIRVGDMSGLADGEETSFGRRCEDDETGRLNFGRGCDGKFEFYGRGQVRGRFFGLIVGETIEFQGVFENALEDRPDHDELEDQWDDFPRRAYGRA
ncbi:hypothetical protein PV11_06418 [Exophiala sideris]|uniref:Uncharacterized protein n=1 Tax=Exophiala sideris TaxID=1016849 RepID=A0A0D1YVB6_9EURO|nr:hypothetical protein PV11_06418 [Exophiala sideris]